MVYLLNADGTTEEYKEVKIGKYFSVSEFRFQEDIRLYDEVVICDLLFKVLNRYRDLKGKPIKINALNRDRKKQLELIARGERAAKISPHEFFLAADCDTTSWEETQSNVILVRQAAKDLGIKVRIGWKEYWEKKKSTFLHIDVCPEYFGKGRIWNKNPHPVQWETANEW